MNSVFGRLSEEQRRVLVAEQTGKSVEFLCRSVIDKLWARHCYKSYYAVCDYIVDSVNPFHPSYILEVIPELQNYDVAFVLSSMLLEPKALAKVSLDNVLLHSGDDCCKAAGNELLKLLHAIFNAFTTPLHCYEYLTAAITPLTAQWFHIAIAEFRADASAVVACQSLAEMMKAVHCIEPNSMLNLKTRGAKRHVWAEVAQDSMRVALSYHIQFGQLSALWVAPNRDELFQCTPQKSRFYRLSVFHDNFYKYDHSYADVKVTRIPRISVKLSALSTTICIVNVILNGVQSEDGQWHHVYLDLNLADIALVDDSSTDPIVLANRMVGVYVNGERRLPQKTRFASAMDKSTLAELRWKPAMLQLFGTRLMDLMFLDRSGQRRDEPISDPSVRQLAQFTLPIACANVLMGWTAHGGFYPKSRAVAGRKRSGRYWRRHEHLARYSYSSLDSSLKSFLGVI